MRSLAEAVLQTANVSAKRIGLTFLPARNEVLDAYASHQKLRCIFNPPKFTTLSDGLQLTFEYVQSHGPYEPTGYSRIEVPKGMPPSWSQWLLRKRGYRLTADKGPVVSTRTVVFIPSAIPAAVRRFYVQRQFNRERWFLSSEVTLFFVIGRKAGPKLELDLNFTSVLSENIDLLVTDCRDYGDEIDNANGTSSTTCEVFESLQYIYRNFRADYVWRGADDAYLNLRQFYRILPELPGSRWWLGRLRVVRTVHEDRDLDLSRQPHLQKIFNMPIFPHYMLGMGFAFSWDVAQHIGSFVIPPHQTWIEDVMVGMWLNPFMVTKVDRRDMMVNREEIKGANISVLLLHYIKVHDWDNINDEGLVSLV